MAGVFEVVAAFARVAALAAAVATAEAAGAASQNQRPLSPIDS